MYCGSLFVSIGGGTMGGTTSCFKARTRVITGGNQLGMRNDEFWSEIQEESNLSPRSRIPAL